jgi:hypothetical protein
MLGLLLVRSLSYHMRVRCLNARGTARVWNCLHVLERYIKSSVARCSKIKSLISFGRAPSEAMVV